jgi:hypothetical protein
VTAIDGRPTSQRLGFGCAWLRVLDDPGHSQRLLDTAYDAGIRHVDVARSYGYGLAEGMVGRFLRGRRDEVTVVTKLGIAPPRVPSSGAVRSLARQLRRFPALHRLARRRVDATVTAGQFSATAARDSLQTSLRELATDHVDVLLLHEVRTDDVTDELLAVLDAALDDGTVRRVGLATDLASTIELTQQHPSLVNAVLVRDSLLAPAASQLPSVPGRLLMTHSALGNDLGPLHEWVTEHRDWARDLERGLGIDLSSRASLAALLLDIATSVNPNGITLFSSHSPDHVVASAQSPGRHSPEQLTGFAAAVRRDIAPVAQQGDTAPVAQQGDTAVQARADHSER